MMGFLLGSGRWSVSALINGLSVKFQPSIAQQERIDELHVLQHKRIMEVPLFIAARANDVSTIQKLLKCHSVDPFEKGVMGETALHIAALYGSYEVATILLEEVPDLINVPATSELYEGKTALHIAVANENIHLVKELINRGADVASSRATGIFFRRSEKNFIYYGNTVLHHLALHARRYTAQMYDFILSLDPERGNPVETITNNNGLTPFKLAALEGNVQLFQHLMRKRKRQIEWFFKPISATFYDLSGIDSWDDDHSVLDLVICSNEVEALKILNLPPIKALIHFKWNRYGKYYFRTIALFYFIYIIIFTSCCIFRPLIPRRDNVTDPRDTQILEEAPLNLCYTSNGDYIRLVGETISVFGAIAILLIESADIFRYGTAGYFGKTVLGGPFHVIIICFAFLVLLILLLRVTSAGAEGFFMALAIAMAWCNSIYFFRGFRILGPFAILLQKIILEKFLTFVILMVMVLIGFTTALHLSFQELDPSQWIRFNDYKNLLFLMFMLFFGLLDIPLNYEKYTPFMVKILYVAYIMMTFQLMAILFIFLIAQTLRRVMKNSDALWQAQITASIIHLERWLPRYFWSPAGVCGLQLGLDNNWYIWVEDTIDSDAQSCSSPKHANVEEHQETRNKTEKKTIGNGTDPNSGVELRILRRRSRAHCSDTASKEVKGAECHL
ncbi:transient receptor potential cation channel subfamily V member 6-like isoform X2 [Chiloscyllium plagiosum]|uniref:transient receptor potential cation channel subfamily V member 6-like isoform X2 n=1 Tax=Chiloscyllium plagiosum TaxID=36176 RepID=UPI001CB81095|nr:transient receptor potential cation channel subfamily V member 6-like isoform X2 [Chiloscyllium plagiosum]